MLPGGSYVQCLTVAAPRTTKPSSSTLGLSVICETGAPEFRAKVDAIINRALADFDVVVAELRELRKRGI